MGMHILEVHRHRIGYNETLADISTCWYGTPHYARAIYEANETIIANPNALTVGQDIIIPRVGPLAVL